MLSNFERFALKCGKWANRKMTPNQAAGFNIFRNCALGTRVMPWMALCWSEKPDKQGDRRHRQARLHSFKNDEMCHCYLFLLCLWLILDNDQCRPRHILGALTKAVASVGFGVLGTRILSENEASTRQVLEYYSASPRNILK